MANESSKISITSNVNWAEIIKNFGEFANVMAGPIIEGIKSAHTGMTQRRDIIRQELESFFKLDTNKNANLGYVIVTGVAIIALLVYNFILKQKK